VKHLYLGAWGRDDARLTALESMALGGLCGGLSAVVTHPIDTIKSNMQSLGGGGYKNSLDCLVKIVRSDGE
jgi:hypothetical protein